MGPSRSCARHHILRAAVQHTEHETQEAVAADPSAVCGDEFRANDAWGADREYSDEFAGDDPGGSTRARLKWKRRAGRGSLLRYRRIRKGGHGIGKRDNKVYCILMSAVFLLLCVLVTLLTPIRQHLCTRMSYFQRRLSAHALAKALFA